VNSEFEAELFGLRKENVELKAFKTSLSKHFVVNDNTRNSTAMNTRSDMPTQSEILKQSEPTPAFLKAVLLDID